MVIRIWIPSMVGINAWTYLVVAVNPRPHSKIAADGGSYIDRWPSDISDSQAQMFCHML